MGFTIAGGSVEWYISYNAVESLAAEAGTFSVQSWSSGSSGGITGACDGRTHLFAGVFGAGATTSVARASVDGGAPYTHTAQLVPAAPTQSDYIGGYIANGFAVSGFSQFLTLAWDRELSGAELRSLTDNPWQLFAPLQRRIYVGPSAGGTNQTVTVPAANVTWAGVAPAITRTAHKTVTVPAANVTWAGAAPTVTQSSAQTVTVPAANVTWAGVAPVIARTANQEVTIPAANVAWAGNAPAVTQAANQTITVPAANVTWAAAAPALTQTAHRTISVPVANVDWAGAAPTVTVSGIILPPAALAEMYGGGAMYPRKKKKKEEPTIEEMVEAVSEEPKGKEKIVALLPKKVRQELPDDMWEVSVDKLVQEVKDASDRVQKGVERLYEKRREKDDDEAFMLLNL